MSNDEVIVQPLNGLAMLTFPGCGIKRTPEGDLEIIKEGEIVAVFPAGQWAWMRFAAPLQQGEQGND